MESRADVGAAGPQSVPDTQGDVGHGQAQVYEKLHDHIDAAGNNAKACLCNAGGLCNPVAQGHKARYEGDDGHHNPSDGAGRHGGVEAVLSGNEGQYSKGFSGACNSVGTLDGNVLEGGEPRNPLGGIVGNERRHHPPDYGLNPAPIFCHNSAEREGPVYQQGDDVDDGAQHRGQPQGRRFDLWGVLLYGVHKVGDRRIDTGPHHLLDVPQGVV